MHFDVPTLMAAGSFVAALSGLVVFLAWRQNLDTPGCLWWAVAGIAQAAGMAVLLLGQTRNDLGLVIGGNIVLAVSPALFWTAARLFSHLRPILWLIPAGVVLLGACSLVPAVRQSGSTQMALGLAVSAIYFYAAAYEFWRGRAEPIGARTPLVILSAVHASMFVTGVVEASIGRFPAEQLVPLDSWFGLIHFEAIIFSLGTAVFVVAFARERGELRQRIAAETDPLTGVASRRAILEYAQARLRECQAADSPISLVVFDLDRFKGINDRFGHASGDAVLQRFGDTVRGVLREKDRVGRLGGEEFALVLPETSLGAAFLVADRIRTAFEAACKVVEGAAIHGTVSAGVTTARPDSTIETMLSAADEGLYRAKALGRNRVERPPVKSPDGRSHLNRVA